MSARIKGSKIYSRQEHEKDNRIVDKLKKAYEKETDPILKAEKYVYFHYFYEARRKKLLAEHFFLGARKFPKELLEEFEDSIYVQRLLCSCSSCNYSHHFAEKGWVSEMEKKLGKEDWNVMVKKMLKKGKHGKNTCT